MPIEQNIELFEASGFSMWPFVRCGDKLIIEQAAAEVLRPGDIVLYEASRQKVCHRLIRKVKRNGTYILYMRGDNSFAAPEAVSQEQLVGKACALIRRDRTYNLVCWRARGIKYFILIVAPFLSRFVALVVPIYKILRSKV